MTNNRTRYVAFAVAAVVILGAAGFAVHWGTRRPDPMAVKMKFKQQLEALGGWNNVEVESRERWGDYFLHAERSGYHFKAWVYASDVLAVDVFRADEYRPDSWRSYDVYGAITFQNDSVTRKNLEKVPADDRGRVLALAEELAEAARRCIR